MLGTLNSSKSFKTHEANFRIYEFAEEVI